MAKSPAVKAKKVLPKKVPAKLGAKVASKVAAGPKSNTATRTATATKTATSTKTATDAYTQGNITVTGGAGKGATSVTIGLPGGSLANNSKKPAKSKNK